MAAHAERIGQKPPSKIRDLEAALVAELASPRSRAPRSPPEMPEATAESSAPAWLTDEPAIEDDFETESSMLQKATAEECLPFLLQPFNGGSRDLPRLKRSKHIAFLIRSLGHLPHQYTGLDASRPWLFYWCLVALFLLGEDVSRYRDEYVSLDPL